MCSQISDPPQSLHRLLRWLCFRLRYTWLADGRGGRSAIPCSLCTGSCGGCAKVTTCVNTAPFLCSPYTGSCGDCARRFALLRSPYTGSCGNCALTWAPRVNLGCCCLWLVLVVQPGLLVVVQTRVLRIPRVILPHIARSSRLYGRAFFVMTRHTPQATPSLDDSFFSDVAQQQQQQKTRY